MTDKRAGLKTLTPFVHDGCTTTLCASLLGPLNTPAPGCLFPGSLVRWRPLKTLRLECELSSLPGLSKQEAGHILLAGRGQGRFCEQLPLWPLRATQPQVPPRLCSRCSRAPHPAPRGAALRALISTAGTKGPVGSPHCYWAPPTLRNLSTLHAPPRVACEGLSG